MRKQEAVIKLLRRLVEIVAEEAKRNPEFERRLEELLVAPPSAPRKKTGNWKATQLSPSELPDIYGERNARGEADFRMWLRDQPVEVLRGVIRQHDLDAARRTSKWKDSEKLGTYIADQLQARATRGASFMRSGGMDDASTERFGRSADWISPEVFEKTEYGRLNKQPGAINFIGPGAPYEVPPGGRIVPDPKEGRYGIVVDRDGTALYKVVLKT
jgi:hypothetical protein